MGNPEVNNAGEVFGRSYPESYEVDGTTLSVGGYYTITYKSLLSSKETTVSGTLTEIKVTNLVGLPASVELRLSPSTSEPSHVIHPREIISIS